MSHVSIRNYLNLIDFHAYIPKKTLIWIKNINDRFCCFKICIKLQESVLRRIIFCDKCKFNFFKIE